MALIDAPQFNLAAQVRQFGQFSSENNQVKDNDVLQCLAAPAQSALDAEIITPAMNTIAQHAAYDLDNPQYLGVFTS